MPQHEPLIFSSVRIRFTRASERPPPVVTRRPARILGMARTILWRNGRKGGDATATLWSGTVCVTIQHGRNARILGCGRAQSICRLVRATEQRGGGESGGRSGAHATRQLVQCQGRGSRSLRIPRGFWTWLRDLFRQRRRPNGDSRWGRSEKSASNRTFRRRWPDGKTTNSEKGREGDCYAFDTRLQRNDPSARKT